MTDFNKIAILDLSGPHQSVVSKFADTYSTAGFAYIKNHGIPQSLIDATFEASKNFHRLNELKSKQYYLIKTIVGTFQ